MAARNGGMRGLAAIAVGSAAAGFGWTAGRDLYRKSAGWAWGVALAAIVAGGSGYAAWNLSRGHREPSLARLLGAAAAAAGSLGLCLAILVPGAAKPAPGASPGSAAGAVAGAVALALAIHAGSALVGLVVGLAQRGGRTRAFAIERHNRDFMAREGIRDVGGREQTYLDGTDTELKLEDVRRDAMVFRLPGRRSVRAYIDLDPEGRMLAYRPAP